MRQKHALELIRRVVSRMEIELFAKSTDTKYNNAQLKNALVHMIKKGS